MPHGIYRKPGKGRFFIPAGQRPIVSAGEARSTFLLGQIKIFRYCNAVNSAPKKDLTGRALFSFTQIFSCLSLCFSL
jgi:hypothetical protein